jgi:hypothetical protein
VGRATRAHGDVLAGAFVVVERDDLLLGAAGWHILATSHDPRDEVGDGWNLWASTADAVDETLRALDVEWLANEPRRPPTWSPERMRLVAEPLVLRTPWSGLASSLLYGIFVALACFSVWNLDVLVWPLTAAIVVAWLAGTIRRTTATLTVDHDGVTVRDTWRSHRLAWEDIEAVGTGFPTSIWNVKNLALQSVAFRVRGRRFLLKATGTATLSDGHLLEQYAAVRPWCLAVGVPAERDPGDPDGPLTAGRTA